MTTSLLDALAHARAALAANDTTAVPSSTAIDVIDELANYGTSGALDAAVTNQQMFLPARLRALFDWNGKASSKPAVRAAATALAATGSDGRSQYPAAVESLSYAAVCAPFLQPDQLTALIAHAAATPFTYAPITAVGATTATLRTLLSHYSAPRRVALLTSLWDAAHNPDVPCWWAATGGRGLGSTGMRSRLRRHDARAQRLQVAAGLDAEVARPVPHLPGHHQPADAPAAPADTRTLTDRILDGDVIAVSDQLARVRALQLTDLTTATVTALVEWAAGTHVNPDGAVVAAHLADLTPRQRPDNPIPAMVEAARIAWTADNGAVDPAAMPDKPTGWASMYPLGALATYPIPAEIAALTGLRVEHPTAAGVPFVIDIVTNDNELQVNGTYMGNCTARDHATEYRAGTAVLARLYHGRETYNCQWNRDTTGRWRLQQINGFSNQDHRVSPWVREWATTALADIVSPDPTTHAS
jgi:hypothetical protein